MRHLGENFFFKKCHTTFLPGLHDIISLLNQVYYESIPRLPPTSFMLFDPIVFAGQSVGRIGPIHHTNDGNYTAK